MTTEQDAAGDDSFDAGEEEFLAFGWMPAQLPGGIAGFAHAGLGAARDDGKWTVVEVTGGARLGRFPTVSAVRRFARRVAGLADWSAPPPGGFGDETLEAARLMALATIEEELAVMRDTIAALETAIADAAERIDDIQAKAILSFADDDDEDETAAAAAAKPD